MGGEVWFHWSPTGALLGDPLHAGTRQAAEDRRRVLREVPWEDLDLDPRVPPYWREGMGAEVIRLRLMAPLVNAGRPVRDDQVYCYPGQAVLYRNAVEDPGSISCVAPLRHWMVVG